MFEQVCGIRRVILCCGTVDMRKGIDGLAQIIGSRYKMNPFENGTLFMFCGKRTDRAKALVWQGNGFILLYRRFEDGRLSWPRTPEEAAELNEEQVSLLLRGFNPIEVRIRDVYPQRPY